VRPHYYIFRFLNKLVVSLKITLIRSHIYGYNYKQEGYSSNRVVFIGVKCVLVSVSAEETKGDATYQDSIIFLAPTEASESLLI
jgi:hypothetical protein